MKKVLPNRIHSDTPYEFYQLKDVGEVYIPKKLEEIFKFPKEELKFVPQDIKPLAHFRYFANYLFYDDNGLNVKTIVVEEDYTCLTFLEDYVNYYAKCYTKYGKSCKRIHLFGEDFGKRTFQKMLYFEGEKQNCKLSKNEKQYSKLWKSYLGCIVIKPLPKGIIGVTYLKTYNGN
jgi:hypothetical protein